MKTRVPGFKNYWSKDYENKDNEEKFLWSMLSSWKFQSQAVNTQDKDYKSIEKEIIRNEKRIGT